MHGTAFPVHPAGTVDGGLKRQYAQIVEVNPRPRAANFQIAQPVDSSARGNIVIGDRSYRIRIKPEDEAPVRETVKVINDKVIEFKTHFSGKDMQDYIAMVLVWYATEQSSRTQQGIDNRAVSEKLGQIEALLDKMNG